MRTCAVRTLPKICRVYLRYVWEQRDALAVLHPWTEDACREMGVKISE